MNKKTRKAIRKSVRKVLKKHGPEIAGHLATGAMAALAAFVAAEPKKGKKLKKLVNAMRDTPMVSAIAEKIPTLDHENDKEEAPKSKADD